MSPMPGRPKPGINVAIDSGDCSAAVAPKLPGPVEPPSSSATAWPIGSGAPIASMPVVGAPAGDCSEAWIAAALTFGYSSAPRFRKKSSAENSSAALPSMWCEETILARSEEPRSRNSTSILPKRKWPGLSRRSAGNGGMRCRIRSRAASTASWGCEVRPFTLLATGGSRARLPKTWNSQVAPPYEEIRCNTFATASCVSTCRGNASSRNKAKRSSST
mmetsp:Transcript_16164/g.41582  ORF Transcript_16164/g.41582 Transcript_16164/m.41582 type:complete len:218 (+) Transcript_16164:254-907(+)